MYEKLELTDSIGIWISKMCMHNPGAATVIRQIYGGVDNKMDDFMSVILDLDDMNIRGPRIWVAFKDWGQGSVEAVIEAARARDAGLVAFLNGQDYHKGAPKVVCRGGSHTH